MGGRGSSSGRRSASERRNRVDVQAGQLVQGGETNTTRTATPARTTSAASRARSATATPATARPARTRNATPSNSVAATNSRRLQASGNNNEVLANIKKTEIRSIEGHDVRIAGSQAYWRADRMDNAITVSKGDREWQISRNPYRTGKKWVATEKRWDSRGNSVGSIGESDSVDTLINKVNKKLAK